MDAFRARVAELVAAYPALAWSLLAIVAGAVVRYVPGLAGFDVDAVAEVLAAVVVAVTGIAIHKRVTPVPEDERGL